MLKTKITDLLDAHQIDYRILSHTKPVFTVDAAAAQRGVVKAEMVKSILLREKKGQRYVMACVTGEDRLDPQAVREYFEGWKRLTFATSDQITTITGYIQGAVAPLCLPDEVPIFFDEAIAHRKRVNISSGDPLAGLELDPQDLITLARANLAAITPRK